MFHDSIARPVDEIDREKYQRMNRRRHISSEFLRLIAVTSSAPINVFEPVNIHRRSLPSTIQEAFELFETGNENV